MVSRQHIIAASVRGHQHAKNGQPNQDAFKTVETKEYQLAAIADGHGSKTCFRSRIGATFAVEESAGLIDELIAIPGHESLHDPEKVFKILLKRWAIRVLKHLKQEPFSREEVGTLSQQQRKTLGKNALIAYGSTLNLVLYYGGKLFIWKVGDGSILIRERADSPVKELLDRKWFGVETLSLSTCNPNKDVEFMILPHQPDALLSCSDGYKNAFKTDLGYYKALDDFCALGATRGADYIQTRLEDWLNETSRLGSGDDITLVLFLKEEETA